MRPLSAIVLAAGKGTRMKSRQAKVTFPIAEKPMIQRVVDTAIKLDCKEVCVVVGYQKESVIAVLEAKECISFVEQTEQNGTGHAVMITEPFFTGKDTDILILCGDVPLLTTDTLTQLYQAHRSSGNACTVLTAFLEDAGKYGRILRDWDQNVCGIIEYKDANESQRQIKEFNTGIYCFHAEALFTALKQISNNNQQGEYYLTDTLQILYNGGKGVGSVVLENLMEVSGVNSQEQLAELEDEFLRTIRLKWLNNGVMMHNPASIYIGDDVLIEADVEIGMNTIIKGNSMLRTGVRIGPNCYIEDSEIDAETILKGFNIIVNSYVHEHQVIPFRETIEEDRYELQ